MTEKELSRYYKLKREIEDLEIRIKEFGDGVKGLQTKDVVISGGGGNISIQEKLMLLQSEYIEKRVSALEQYKEIERYIEDIDDPEVRTIMRLRFMDLLSWEEIGKRTYQDKKTASKKMRIYLKVSNSPNSPSKCGNIIL